MPATTRPSERSLVFIPTFNERENVEKLYSQISALDLDADVLFLDDNSPDGTGAVLDRMAAAQPRLTVLHRPGKAGIGSAHLEGIRWAYDHGYTRLITMDCDFTHPPKYIPDMLSMARDCDLVVGSRWLREKSLEEWNAYRKVLTVLGHALTKFLLGMSYDATGAYRLYRLDRIPRELFDIVESRSYSFFFESLHLLHFNRFSIRELPITLPARTYGHSKMSLKEAARSVRQLLRLALVARLSPHRFRPSQPVPASGIEASAEWDAYWLGKKEGAAGILFDVIAAFYRKWIIRRALNHFARRHFHPGSELLHAGCGSGQVDADISKVFRITALDVSPRALEIYRKVNGPVSLVLHGSVFKIPLEAESMDGVYNLGVMEHFTEDEISASLREFRRVLKPNGKALLFWPPEFGLSVLFLRATHFILNRVLKRGIKLHPDEITRVRSKGHARTLLAQAGFRLDQFYFGPKDFFTHAVVVAIKEPSATAIRRPESAVVNV